MGLRHDLNMRHELALSNPKEFYHEVHRPSKFMNFASIEEGADTVGADREYMFGYVLYAGRDTSGNLKRVKDGIV